MKFTGKNLSPWWFNVAKALDIIYRPSMYLSALYIISYVALLDAIFVEATLYIFIRENWHVSFQTNWQLQLVIVVLLSIVLRSIAIGKPKLQSVQMPAWRWLVSQVASSLRRTGEEATAEEKRRSQKNLPATMQTFPCNRCGKTCQSWIGLDHVLHNSSFAAKASQEEPGRRISEQHYSNLLIRRSINWPHFKQVRYLS